MTVSYENVDDATFDLDYYLNKHVPMVSERSARFGSKGWFVLQDHKD